MSSSSWRSRCVCEIVAATDTIFSILAAGQARIDMFHDVIMKIPLSARIIALRAGFHGESLTDVDGVVPALVAASSIMLAGMLMW